jgi:hypothetical protein
MKLHKSFVAWVLVGVLACTLVLQFGGAGTAQVAGEGSPDGNIQVVGFANGQVGFFDPSAKQLYVYGPDLQIAVKVVKINRLGQTLQLVQRSGR